MQVLGLGSVAVVLGRSALLVVGSISASRQLHERLLTKMLRLPMSFYDAQPTGGSSVPGDNNREYFRIMCIGKGGL
jgi:ABC-type bacteriocin/lantibiotic exporter with double-glycine peptidase domain